MAKITSFSDASVFRLTCVVISAIFMVYFPATEVGDFNFRDMYVKGENYGIRD